jgi:hypothetical protein
MIPAALKKMMTEGRPLVVLNDGDTFADLKDCKIVWTNPLQDLDETHPMECNDAEWYIDSLMCHVLDVPVHILYKTEVN